MSGYTYDFTPSQRLPDLTHITITPEVREAVRAALRPMTVWLESPKVQETIRAFMRDNARRTVRIGRHRVALTKVNGRTYVKAVS